MGLFENFPYTNFHELNLDWIIQKLKEQGMNAVLSVNGQTGDVILYENPYVEFPEITNPSWKIFRMANGKEVGIYFANDHVYFVDGSVISQIYTENDTPPYPVTSVNGQTGDVQLYQEAGIRFPNVPDAFFNMRRQINTGGSDQAIVGLEVTETGAKRMKDNLRYDIYDTGNPPPYPVTSINGQTGAVILAIPFNAPLSDSTWIASQASATHQAGMARQTMDGTVSMYMTSDANHAEAFVKFTSADEQTTYIRKLLTTDDIPSGAGVVSVNGLSGVVLITGEQINTNAIDGVTINSAIQNLKAADAILQNAIGYVCDGNTCAASVAAGQYVILKNSTITGCADGLYTAAQAIPANTAIDATYLTAVTGGAANSLSDAITNLYELGNWTPTFGRDTATSLYATWIRVGLVLFITADWQNTHSSGASFINSESLPVPSGYALNYGFHGTWRSYTTDVAGEVGQYDPSNNMRFSKGGVGVELPDEKISFNAFCVLRKT